MSIQNVTEPATWQSFDDNTIDSFVGLKNEPFLDRRNGGLKLRIGDGVTPGGIDDTLKRVGGIKTPATLSMLTSDGIDRFGTILLYPFTGIKTDGVTIITHLSTEWIISSSQDVNDAIFTSIDDNLTSLDLSKINNILRDTNYWLFVTYKGDSGYTSATLAVPFNTGTAALETPYQTFAGNVGGFSYANVSAVSSAGERAIMSDPYNNNGAGTVYLHKSKRGFMGYKGALQSPNPRFDNANPLLNGGHFGYSVSISDNGNIIAIGAPGENLEKGYVYIYEIRDDQYHLITSIENPYSSDITVPKPRFGTKVVLSGSGRRLAVSCEIINTNKVSVYIFENLIGSWQIRDQSPTSQDLSTSIYGSGALTQYGKNIEFDSGGRIYVMVSGEVRAAIKIIEYWQRPLPVNVLLPLINDARITNTSSTKFGNAVAISNTSVASTYVAIADTSARIDGGAITGGFSILRIDGEVATNTVVTYKPNLEVNGEYGSDLAFNYSGSKLFVGAPTRTFPNGSIGEIDVYERDANKNFAYSYSINAGSSATHGNARIGRYFTLASVELNYLITTGDNLSNTATSFI